MSAWDFITRICTTSPGRKATKRVGGHTPLLTYIRKENGRGVIRLHICSFRLCMYTLEAYIRCRFSGDISSSRPSQWLGVGHIRPMLAVAVRLVLERPNVIITVTVAPMMLERAFSDIATQLSGPALDKARRRIRVMAPISMPALASASGDKGLFGMLEVVIGTYPALYQCLLERKPLKCEATGTLFDAVSPPSLVIADFFGLGQTLATRAATGREVPILMFVATSAVCTTRHTGPEEVGGLGDLGAKIDAEAARTGRPAIEVGEELIHTFTGEVVNLTGIPPLYDYELFPQMLPFDAPLAAQLRLTYPTLKECDGLLITTCAGWENGGSFAMLKSWMADWGKDTYGLGPVLPLDYASGAVSSRGATDVEQFLSDKKEKSVLFISFGTVFWPSKQEYILELVDALVEKDMPFLFCHASPFATVTDELKQKVEGSGIGLLTTWAPQQYVLNHPAIGWFLTHGGHNSVTESLSSGVPMIFWPFTGDQPVAAAMVEAQGAGIELVEVRTGPHATGRPVYRRGPAVVSGTQSAVGAELRGVLEELRGARGSAMRAAAERIAGVFGRAWEEGGEGRVAFGEFVRKYVDGRGVVGGVGVGSEAV